MPRNNSHELGASGSEVKLHCGGGGAGIASLDRVNDEFVPVKAGFPKKLEAEKVDEVKHPGAGILDRLGEECIACGTGDREMKCGVCVSRFGDVRRQLQSLLSISHRCKVGGGAFARSDPAGGTLDGDAEVCQHQNAFGAVQKVIPNFGRIDGRLTDDGATGGTAMDGNVPARLQHPQRLAQSFACHPELLGKLALRRKTVSGLDSAQRDLSTEIVDDSEVSGGSARW